MTTTTTPGTPATLAEILESLTGFDEIEIKERFDCDMGDIESLPFRVTTRVCIYAELRHQGVEGDEAYRRTMSMPMRQVGDHFTKNTDVDDEGDEDSDSGKDDSQPAVEPPS